MTEARWKYWDVTGLVAGATPIFLALITGLFGDYSDSMMIFTGFVGAVPWLISLLCLGLWVVCAVAGWRFGDRRMILGGGVLLALCAAPSVLLIAACFSGNCI